LIGLPYLVTLLFSPEGLTFLGSFGNPDDTSAYLSAMGEGARGGWLLAWDAEGRIEQGMQLFLAFKERYLSEIYADQWGFHLYEVRPR
jgi:hypothetical protein